MKVTSCGKLINLLITSLKLIRPETNFAQESSQKTWASVSISAVLKKSYWLIPKVPSFLILYLFLKVTHEELGQTQVTIFLLK
jgi:hypothetical protein